LRSFLTLLVFAIFTQWTFAQNCEYENSVFKAKERITYQVFYNVSFVWIPAGEFRFEVFESEEEYFIECKGITYESYNSIFEVNDYFSSRIDKKTGRPIEFIRNINEGGYTKFDSIHFDHENLKATGKLGKTRELANPYDLTISECAHDMLSIIYAFRNIKFNEMERGEEIPFVLLFDKEEFPLKMKYQGIKRKKIRKLGKRFCHLITPQVVAGSVFDEDSEMKIWVTNDEHQFALMAESPISVGSVKAVIKKVEGIEYDLFKKPSR